MGKKAKKVKYDKVAFGKPGYLKGYFSEHTLCIDCGINTHPGEIRRADMEKAMAAASSVLALEDGVPVQYDERCETYYVRDVVWKLAGMEPWGGCLCIGCLEKR